MIKPILVDELAHKAILEIYNLYDVQLSYDPDRIKAILDEMNDLTYSDLLEYLYSFSGRFRVKQSDFNNIINKYLTSYSFSDRQIKSFVYQVEAACNNILTT